MVSSWQCMWNTRVRTSDTGHKTDVLQWELKKEQAQALLKPCAVQVLPRCTAALCYCIARCMLPAIPNAVQLASQHACVHQFNQTGCRCTRCALLPSFKSSNTNALVCRL
jgi:hypothetical protein